MDLETYLVNKGYEVKEDVITGNLNTLYQDMLSYKVPKVPSHPLYDIIMVEPKVNRNVITSLFNHEYPTITIELIEMMFFRYNEVFFNNLLPIVKFGLSNSDKVSSTYKDGTILISSTLLEQITDENVLIININGITPTNRIQACQLVLEHQLIHIALHTIGFETKHTKVFETAAFKLFGHMKYNHKIELDKTPLLTAFNPQNKKPFYVGQKVYGINEGKVMAGIITKCNPKRAVVDVDGSTYSVDYIALSQIPLA